MLDDLNIIEQKDPYDALGVAAKQPEQLQITGDLSSVQPFEVAHIVLAGMGGSALAGLIVRRWLEDQLTVPFTVTRNYQLPNFVNQHSLVIVSSYSGNTEETVATLEDARAKGAKLVVMAAGGKLVELANQHGFPVLTMPQGYQPRMAVWFAIKLLALLFDHLKLTEKSVSQLEAVRSKVQDQVDHNMASVPTVQNPAKQLAEQLVGKLIFIYGGPTLGSVAYKWKIDFNENAKNLATYNEFPEFNHNEMLAWTGQPVEKPFAVIELQSSYDVDRIKKRFEVTNKLLSGRMPKAQIVSATGETKIEQILNTVILGDFVSIYLAILNGVNPTKVDLIEALKRELG